MFSFGGTKNGLMYGEAVVFTAERLALDFNYVRKQGLQLASKMRFIATQFAALLADDLWLRNAAHANLIASLLAKELAQVPRLSLSHPVETNAVFVRIPREFVAEIQREYFCHVWDERTSDVRLMTAFDTTEADVRALAALIRQVMK